MEIKSFYEPETGTWTHLLADPNEKKAAVIDPVWAFDPVSGYADSGFIDKVLDYARASGYAIEWVLETHAHADHLTAAGLIRERTGAKIACSAGICSVQRNFTRVFNMTGTPADGSQFDRLLSEGDMVRLGALEIHVMETPGHTADSITYHVENVAFIGDTLFAPQAGTARCDFPGGNASQLYDSIRKLYRLPGETRLFLCHDYPKKGDAPVRDFSVTESKQTNVHVSADTDREEFIALRTGRDAGLDLPRLILPSLQVNILAGGLPPADANGTSYLRIPFNRSIGELIKGEVK